MRSAILMAAVAALCGCRDLPPSEVQKPIVLKTMATVSQPVAQATSAAILAPLPTAGGREVPAPWRGLTIDSIADFPAVLAAVKAHRARPMVRVVMDPGTRPADYAAAITQLRSRAYILAEPIDSTAMRALSLNGVHRRMRAFATALAGQVDYWEIGNEINGEWVGSDPAEINAKVQAAYDEVKAAGGRTMVTLNFWSGPDCYAKPWEPTLYYPKTMARSLRRGIDVVSLSLYETACAPAQHPSAEQLANTFNKLALMFPNARLAMGEVGAQRMEDGLPADPTLAEKKRIARTYYGMQQELANRVGPRFAGGYFWWYYVEDAVPRTRPDTLWPTLDALFVAM